VTILNLLRVKLVKWFVIASAGFCLLVGGVWWKLSEPPTFGPVLSVRVLAPEDWQVIEHASLSVGHDPQGRFLNLLRFEHKAGSKFELDVLDTQLGRMTVIQATCDVHRDDTRFVAPRGQQWSDGCLTIDAWHARESLRNPRGIIGSLAGTLGSPKQRDLQSEAWTFDTTTNRLARIGTPNLGYHDCSVSRDGRWRVERSEDLVIRDCDGSRVCRSQSVVHDGVLIPWPQSFWLADPDELLILDAASVRALNVRSNKVLWSQPTTVLARDVFQYFGPPVSKPWKGLTTPPPGLYGGQEAYHTADGETNLHCYLMRQSTTKFGFEGAEVWRLHLPSRKWTRLPVPHSDRAVHDPQGRFSLVFRDDEEELVIEKFSVANATPQILARVPADVTYPARILPNPDRLFWLTKTQQVFMLPLDHSADPQQIWPPAR
jgi:hypothetical protein